jgi:hypothetical protein
MNAATRAMPGALPYQRRGAAALLPWVVGLSCLVLAGVADAVLKHEHGISGDEPFYTQMAAHPGAAHSFPYAYRVAVPWLVHILPFSQSVAFQLQALVFIGAAGGVLYVLLEDFATPRGLAWLLALGFAISPNLLVVLLRHGRSIDPAVALVMIAGTLFIVRRRKLALAVTVLIGVAVKETSLFLIPFAYAVWARQVLDREALRDTALVAIAPVAGYLILHATVTSIGSSYAPGYDGGSFLHARLDVFRQVLTGTALRRVVYAYGPLWLVAPVALWTLSFARRGLVLVAECIVAMTVSYDAGRIIFLAVAVFYVAAAWVIRDRRRLAIATVACLFALDIGYAVYMQVHGVQHGLDTNPRSAIPVH